MPEVNPGGAQPVLASVTIIKYIRRRITDHLVHYVFLHPTIPSLNGNATLSNRAARGDSVLAKCPTSKTSEKALASF